MRKDICSSILCFLFFILCFLSAGPCFAAEWQELRGDHFIVFYVAGEDFAKEVLRKSEYYYTSIAEDLGYARYSNFWQWENRAKSHIYPVKADFLKATGQPDWSVGNAEYFKKEINSYAGCGAFLISTLPHEITHLVFRDFVGFKGEVPLWLDEGVAQWEEPAKRKIVKYVAKSLFLQKKLIPLKTFMQIDVRKMKADEDVQVFYVQAASIVGFLIERYGGSSFTQFCRQLRDGRSLDESLRLTFSTQMDDLSALETRWLEYIESLDISAESFNKDALEMNEILQNE